MTIYIELVFVDNLVIDFLLLKATHLITKKNYATYRLLLSGVLGAVLSLIYPLITGVGFFLPVIKILSGLLLVLVSNTFNSAKEFYFCSIIFFLLTFITGGGIYFIAHLFNVTHLTKYSSIFIVLPFYVVIKLTLKTINIIYTNKKVAQYTFCTEIMFENFSITHNGFLDTGNGVYYKTIPVIFADVKLIDSKNFSILIKKAKKISVNTVNGEEQKYCFLAKRVILSSKDKKISVNGVYVCFTKINNFSGYKIILHPDLIGGENVENVKDSVEKAS